MSESERVGRLNTTTQINNTTIQKVAHIEEADRPVRLGVEAWALTLARQRGADVPELYAYSRDTDDHEVLTMERIEGTPLEKVPDFRSRASSMFKVGQQLLLLQNVSPTFGWIDVATGIGSHDNWKQFLVDYVDRFAAILAEANLLEPDLGQRLLQATKDIDGYPGQAALVHRDVKPGNLMLRPSGDVAIIDWENAILGDSLFDVAIYETREGQGLASAEFARGGQLDRNSPRFRVYGAIALLGITDFLREYHGEAEDQAARLSEHISQL